MSAQRHATLRVAQRAARRAEGCETDPLTPNELRDQVQECARDTHHCATLHHQVVLWLHLGAAGMLTALMHRGGENVSSLIINMTLSALPESVADEGICSPERAAWMTCHCQPDGLQCHAHDESRVSQVRLSNCLNVLPFFENSAGMAHCKGGAGMGTYLIFEPPLPTFVHSRVLAILVARYDMQVLAMPPLCLLRST